MEQLERPRLRPLSGRRIDHGGRSYVALEDPLGAFREPVLVPLEKFHQVLRHCDGRTTLAEIRDRVEAETGRCPSLDELEGFLGRLDRALVLDGPAFAAYRSAYADVPVRPPALAGRSYPADPGQLRASLDRFYAPPDGAGIAGTKPESESHAPNLRAILSPHIDFGRGGSTYSWAYRELVERSDADLFVILGVAHQPCRHRFALTRKHFETPLGVARTDRSYVERVAEVAGAGLFEDELAHRGEHSIEFQVVFLQHALGGRREFEIVPILVGSFHDLMRGGVEPIADPEVARLLEGLRRAEAESGRRVAYIGGIDLCHVGPEFGDPSLLDDATLDQVRAFDRGMLASAVEPDPASWFGRAAEVDNRWRVCGLAATYTMLHAIGPARGRLLRYDQAVNPGRTCCVSFASVAYDESTEA